MSHSSARNAFVFSTLLIATVCIAAIGSLAACKNEEETSSGKTGPGSIRLTLKFPIFTGAEAITAVTAALEKADGTGTPRTLEIKEFSKDSNAGSPANTITLSFGSVPPDQYILILRFYRGDTVAALHVEGVTTRPEEETNKWQGGDGGMYSTRTFKPEEFRSMAVAVSFILKNSDASLVLLSMTDPPFTWELDKTSVKNNGAGMRLEISLYGGPGTSLLAVTLNGEDKLSLFTPVNSSASVPVYTGTLNIGTGQALIRVEAQAPDRATTVSYTIGQG